MRARTIFMASALLASPVSFAGGLSGAVLPCEASKSELSTASIDSDIATAVVRTLLGTTIDAAVNYLDTPKITKFDVVIPVDSTAALTGKNQCIYISSTRIQPTSESNPVHTQKFIDDATLFIKIQLSKSEQAGKDNNHPLRANILKWKYGAFLSDKCPLLRSCTKRDVVMKLGLMIPSSSVANTAHASEPFGFLIENATAAEVQNAVLPLDSTYIVTLPWITFAEPTGPLNVRFELIETSQPNAFTKALAAAVKDQKVNIQDTVENKIKGISDQVAASAAQARVSEAAKAFEAYKNAFDALSTTATAHKSATGEQKNYLAAQYAIQRKTVELAEILGKAAFKVADINWPAGGLGPLPTL